VLAFHIHGWPFPACRRKSKVSFSFRVTWRADIDVARPSSKRELSAFKTILGWRQGWSRVPNHFQIRPPISTTKRVAKTLNGSARRIVAANGAAKLWRSLSRQRDCPGPPTTSAWSVSPPPFSPRCKSTTWGRQIVDPQRAGQNAPSGGCKTPKSPRFRRKRKIRKLSRDFRPASVGHSGVFAFKSGRGPLHHPSFFVRNIKKRKSVTRTSG